MEFVGLWELGGGGGTWVLVGLWEMGDNEPGTGRLGGE